MRKLYKVVSENEIITGGRAWFYIRADWKRFNILWPWYPYPIGLHVSFKPFKVEMITPINEFREPKIQCKVSAGPPIDPDTGRPLGSEFSQTWHRLFTPMEQNPYRIK